MATSSIMGGTPLAGQPAGKDTDALGPSDNSDSGSDAQGAYGDGELASDSDAAGTGERATAGSGMDRADADILPDRLDSASGRDDGSDIEGAQTSGVDNIADADARDGVDGEDLA